MHSTITATVWDSEENIFTTFYIFIVPTTKILLYTNGTTAFFCSWSTLENNSLQSRRLQSRLLDRVDTTTS